MLGWEVFPRIGFGNFSVSPHGVGIALGYFLGTWLTARKAKKRGMDEDLVWNAAAAGVIGAVIGARAAYVAGHLSEFESPVEWFQIWRGGLSLIGSLIGAFTAGYIYTRRKHIDFFDIADLGMPFLALGIAVGRSGDLIIGDHLGKETSGWWGWRYKGGELISPPPCTYSTPDGCIEPGMVVHQTALYDAVWSLLIFGILMFLARKPRNRGFFVLTWASLYSVGRVATDFTRVDKRWLSDLFEPWLGQGLTGSQLTVAVALVVSLYALVKYRGVPPPKAGEPQEPSAADAASERSDRPAGLNSADAVSPATPVTPASDSPSENIPSAQEGRVDLAPEPPPRPPAKNEFEAPPGPNHEEKASTERDPNKRPPGPEEGPPPS